MKAIVVAVVKSSGIITPIGSQPNVEFNEFQLKLFEFFTGVAWAAVAFYYASTRIRFAVFPKVNLVQKRGVFTVRSRGTVTRYWNHVAA